MTEIWDSLRAELYDTIKAQAQRPQADCIYCGAPTRSLNKICCRNHDDLPRLDPNIAEPPDPYALPR